MLNLCILFWKRFIKKHFAPSGLVFILTWVGLILVILALSGFAHWYSLYANSVQSAAEVENETGISELATRTQPGTATVTPVLAPTISPVRTTPPPARSSSSITKKYVRSHPGAHTPVTNGTPKANAGQQPTPRATVIASPTAWPTVTPIPTPTPDPVPTPTPSPSVTTPSTMP